MTQQQTEGTPRTLWAALAAFQAEMPVVPKAKLAQLGQYSYKYADLADISAAAMPLLAKYGLSFSCTPELTERGTVLHGTLFFSSGEYLRGTLAVSGSRPQEIGSSLTYARRYLLGCLTGIVTDEDDDGQMAQAAGKRKPAAEKPDGPARTVRRKPRAPAGQPVADVPLPDDPSWAAPWAGDDSPVSRSSGGPPEAQPHAAPQGVPAPAEGGPGDSLRRSLMAASSRVGIDPTLDRDMRLALWSALLARRVGSTNELQRGEALQLLRRLNDIETGAVEWDYDIQRQAVTLRHIDREPG